jgi:DNA-binding transcriptional LysR family regulator
MAFDTIESALEDRGFDPYKARCTYKIMMTDYTGFMFLPHIIKEVENYPNIKIEVIPWKNLVDLNHYECDLAVGFDQAIVPKGYSQHTLYQDKYVCMCKKDHPRIKNDLSLDSFLKEKHMIVREQDGAIGVVNKALEKINLQSKRKITSEVAHFLLSPFIIANTELLITTTNRNARFFEKQLPLKILDVPLDIPTIAIKLFYHNRVKKSSSQHWLRELVIDISKRI